MLPALGVAAAALAAVIVSAGLIGVGRRLTGRGLRAETPRALMHPWRTLFLALRKRPELASTVLRGPFFLGVCWVFVAELAAWIVSIAICGGAVDAAPILVITLPLLGGAVSVIGTLAVGLALRDTHVPRYAARVVGQVWGAHGIAAVGLLGPAYVAAIWQGGTWSATARGWPMLALQPLSACVVAVCLVLGAVRLPQSGLRQGNWLGVDLQLQFAGWPWAVLHLSEHLHILRAACLLAIIYLPSGPGLCGVAALVGLTLGAGVILEWVRPRLGRRFSLRSPWAPLLFLAILNLAITIGVSWLTV